MVSMVILYIYRFTTISISFLLVTVMNAFIRLSTTNLFQVIYCEKTCQKMHWFTHKKVCKKLQEQREKQEAESAKLRMQQSPGALSTENIHLKYLEITECFNRSFCCCCFF